MSRTYKDTNKAKGGRPRQQRNISVRAVRRDPPDLRKLSRALIALALSETAAKTDSSPAAEPEQPDPATENRKAADDR